MGRPDRNFFAPTVPGTVAALARAWHRWVGWERGHGQQLPLECGAARDHPGGVGGPPFPLSSWCPAGMGHPGMGLSCAWFPYGAKGHAGMLLIPAPPSLRTDPGAGWGGGVPKGPLQGRAAWRGRRPHLPRPCPCPHSRSQSKPPVPPRSVPFGGRSVGWGRPHPVPHPANANSPTQHHQPPPRQGQWVPGSSQNPGPSGRAVGSEAAGGGGPACAPHVAGEAGAKQADASLGVPRSGGACWC